MITDAQTDGYAVTPGDRLELIKQCAKGDDIRKQRARDRWMIYTEDHKPLIYARLRATLNDEAYRDEVIKHVDLSDNPALDAIRNTCVVWSQGARRTIADASKSESSAFNELVTESLIDVHAPHWNRIAEFVGPIIVVPAIRKKMLRWDVLLPTYYDVIPDPDDVHGTPLAVAWPIRGAKPNSSDPSVGILDSVGWSFWTVQHGKVTQYGPTIEHGLGRFPGVPLRFDAPYDADYYGQTTRHQRFVDASVAVGAIKSSLNLTRKAQNGKLLTVIGFLGDAAKQQPMDPETGIELNVDLAPGKTAPSVQTLDFDTSPANSIAHANDHRRAAAAVYGGALSDDGRMMFDSHALTEVRREQIPRARVFERDLWINAVELCRHMGHPLAPNLPQPDLVGFGFTVDFGKLARSFAEPKQEAEHKDWLLSKGAIDQLDILCDQGNENLDDEQLKARLVANLENQAWFNDAVTTRNLNMTGGNVTTAAQAFGATGPAIRDAQTDTAPDGAKTPEGTP